MGQQFLVGHTVEWQEWLGPQASDAKVHVMAPFAWLTRQTWASAYCGAASEVHAPIDLPQRRLRAPFVRVRLINRAGRLSDRRHAALIPDGSIA
jgi:hypothetical protein